MNATFSKSDRKFLRAVGISAEPTHDEPDATSLSRITQPDATVRPAGEGGPTRSCPAGPAGDCGKPSYTTRNVNKKWCTNCRAVISLDNYGRCSNCKSDALVVDAPPPGQMLVQTSDGGLYHVPSANIAKAKAIDPKLTILHVEPSLRWTSEDRTLLTECGITAWDGELEAERAHESRQDGTVKLLKKFGIPVTRENYLRLAFAGNPPEVQLDGEIEAELPRELQRVNTDDINNAPSAERCDEPSYTTRSGIPICERCGKSTRNRNALTCAPCRNRTRLLLTDTDKQLLRAIGITQ